MAIIDGVINRIVVNDQSRRATVTIGNGGETYKVTDDHDSSFGGMLNLCIASKIHDIRVRLTHEGPEREIDKIETL
jgi:hypothetical protein